MNAAQEHEALHEQLLLLRAWGPVPEDLEEQLLARLDLLWAQLTEIERDAERSRAATRRDRLRDANVAGLPFVDVAIHRGVTDLPRKAA